VVRGFALDQLNGDGSSGGGAALLVGGAPAPLGAPYRRPARGAGLLGSAVWGMPGCWSGGLGDWGCGSCTEEPGFVRTKGQGRNA
jgi:hypothetical protein